MFCVKNRQNVVSMRDKLSRKKVKIATFAMSLLRKFFRIKKWRKAWENVIQILLNYSMFQWINVGKSLQAIHDCKLFIIFQRFGENKEEPSIEKTK